MPSTTTVSPTKERLRTSALDLIADQGMAALSVRSLCRAVGIRESSFYAHFPSKEALLEDLLERAGAEEPLRIAERLAARCLPLRGFVEQLVAELTMLWTEPQGRKLRVLLEAEVSRDPAMRERFNARVLEMIDTVGRELQRHVHAGTLTPHAPTPVMAWALVSPIAVMRFSLFAHGTSEQHMAHGIALATALGEAWLRAHAVPEHTVP